MTRQIKSAYRATGPSGQCLSLVSEHEVTMNISTPPPWVGCWSIAGLASALDSPVHNFTPGYMYVERGTLRARRLAQKHNKCSVPSQDSNPDHSIQSLIHCLVMRPLHLHQISLRKDKMHCTYCSLLIALLSDTLNKI